MSVSLRNLKIPQSVLSDLAVPCNTDQLTSTVFLIAYSNSEGQATEVTLMTRRYTVKGLKEPATWQYWTDSLLLLGVLLSISMTFGSLLERMRTFSVTTTPFALWHTVSGIVFDVLVCAVIIAVAGQVWEIRRKR